MDWSSFNVLICMNPNMRENDIKKQDIIDSEYS